MVTILALVATIAFYAVVNGKESAQKTALDNQVVALNNAVKFYALNSGRELSSSMSSEQVIAALQSLSDSASRVTHVGFSGHLFDPQLLPVRDAASASAPAIVWQPSQKRFVLQTTGQGIVRFDRQENAVTPTVETRESALKFAAEDKWVWDYTDRVLAARQPHQTIAVASNELPAPATPGPAGGPLSTLSTPLVSPPGGFYDFDSIPQVTLTNPNPPGVSRLLYSIDGGPWEEYASPVQIPAEFLSTLKTFTHSLDPDWLNSATVTEVYESFFFSGSGSGTFGSETGPAGMVAVTDNAADGSATFEWGTPAPDSFTNELHFEGADFSNISPDQEFLVGTLSYRNGDIYDGTEANSVNLSIGLALNVGTVSGGAQLSLNLINTVNYDYQSNDDNADYVQITNSGDLEVESGGRIYTVEFRFGEATAGSFTTIDEFHVWEGYTASGNLYATLSEVAP